MGSDKKKQEKSLGYGWQKMSPAVSLFINIIKQTGDYIVLVS